VKYHIQTVAAGNKNGHTKHAHLPPSDMRKSVSFEGCFRAEFYQNWSKRTFPKTTELSQNIAANLRLLADIPST
jgi:hypothetical protein